MTQKLKEIQITPRISAHDYQTKLNSAIRFMAKDKNKPDKPRHKVKIVLTLRGREYFTHKEHSAELLNRMCTDLSDISVIESNLRDGGPQQKKMIVILRPR